MRSKSKPKPSSIGRPSERRVLARSGPRSKAASRLKRTLGASLTRRCSAIGLASLSYGISQSFAGTTPLVDANTTKASVGVALSFSNDRYPINVEPQLIYALAADHLFATQRGIPIFAGNASDQINLNDKFTIVSRGAWQYTKEQLLPGSLLFQIGGPSTVRGYPSDGVGGDSGYFIENELHYADVKWTKGIDVYALADVGQVFSTFPAVTSMASVGMGMGYTWPNRATFDVSVALPVISAVSDQSQFAIYAKLAGAL